MALQAPSLACLLIEEFSDHQNNNKTTSSRLSSLRISAMDNPCFVFVSSISQRTNQMLPESVLLASYVGLPNRNYLQLLS